MTRRPRRVSRRTQSTVALGFAVSLLLGSGVISFVSDSVQSVGNGLRAGTYAAPPADTHDLKVARVEDGSSCEGATYTDGPMTAAISEGEIDLASGDVAQVDTFCLKNVGSATGGLTVTTPLSSYDESELGVCEDTEAVSDTSCGAGDRGELSIVVEAAVLPLDASTSDTCVGSGWVPITDLLVGAGVDDFLDPGETCEVYLAARVPASEPDHERLAAQTDRLQFDLVFTLHDDGPDGSGDF